MYRAGLTGGIGSGKSTVARILEVLGVPVFHADEEGKRLLNENAEVRRKVISAFGASLYANNQIDRGALAAIVFNNTDALAELNAIVHPAVREQFRSWAEEQKAPYVVMEAAILVESGGYKALDHLVVVTAPEGERASRVMARDGVSEEQVHARLRNQASDVERMAIADTVINNDGSQLVIPQVLSLHEALLKKAHR